MKLTIICRKFFTSITLLTTHAENSGFPLCFWQLAVTFPAMHKLAMNNFESYVNKTQQNRTTTYFSKI